MTNIINIGIAEMGISDNPNDRLVAANLGSCIAVSAYDPGTNRGGMIHCLLPSSELEKSKTLDNPCMYVDTGVARMLQSLLDLGSKKRDLAIFAAGGAWMHDEHGFFDIGKKNFMVLKKLLAANNLQLRASDTGGEFSRTLTLDIGSGNISLKTNGETVQMI